MPIMIPATNRSVGLPSAVLSVALLCFPLSPLNALNSNAGAIGASTTATQLPEFEVATVRPSDPNKGGMVGLYTYPGGRIQAGYCTLRTLLEYAFSIQPFQIEGGPHWINEEHFEITAIPPDSSAARRLMPASIKEPPNKEQRQMLQALLIDRFGLKYHFKTKEGKVYWMVRKDKELRLTGAKDKTQLPFVNVNVYHDGVGNGEMVGQNTSMGFMAQRLSRILGVPVIDKTGIAGTFDFHVPAPESANADITNATLEGLGQLGLKLRTMKGQVQVLIVDGASKPGPN
ncbi:MAG TPA: TIGR03435 family protein [Terracidiphilus sp.]|nr:TIGR03435 family protein [Terracidiphilus sp.]